MDEFARRLRYAIERSGMQQKELAASIELSAARLSNYVNGHSEPSFDILCLLCRKLNVSSDYLIGLSDAQPSSLGFVLNQTTPRDPLSDLDPDLRSKAEGYIDSLRETQASREATSQQEA